MCGGAPDRSAVALVPTLRGGGAARRGELVRRWAALCALGEVVELTDVHEPEPDAGQPSGADPEGPEPADSPVSRAGYEQSALLLAACHLALARGLTRVVWPIHIGDVGALGGADQPPPLDLIADACDRSMLAAQLASVDAGRASMGVTIELPYVDFTDKQMIEVALDLGVPMSACWWCQREGAKGSASGGAGGAEATPCGQCEACARWQRALTAASPGTTMTQIVTRPASQRGQRSGT